MKYPYFIICSVLIILSMSTSALKAGDISLPKNSYCDIRYDGSFRDGDVERLEKIFSDLDFATKVHFRLCLNSAGGSFKVGLKLIKWLIDTGNVYTVVNAGDSCYSACALAFMFGNHNEGDGIVWPVRELHPHATLGFHSPHINPSSDTTDAALSAKAYRYGVAAIGQLLELDWDNWFPQPLLIDALKRGPEEYLFADSVARAAAWDIRLLGIKSPKIISRAMLEQACLNSARNSENKWSGRWWGAEDSPTGQREKITESNAPVKLKRKRMRFVVKNFGAEDSFVCVTDIYNTGKRGLFVDVNFGGSVNDPKIPKPRKIRAVVKETPWGGVPNWFLYPGAMKLRNLPIR